MYRRDNIIYQLKYLRLLDAQFILIAVPYQLRARVSIEFLRIMSSKIGQKEHIIHWCGYIFALCHFWFDFYGAQNGNQSLIIFIM